MSSQRCGDAVKKVLCPALPPGAAPPVPVGRDVFHTVATFARTGPRLSAWGEGRALALTDPQSQGSWLILEPLWVGQGWPCGDRSIARSAGRELAALARAQGVGAPRPLNLILTDDVAVAPSSSVRTLQRPTRGLRPRVGAPASTSTDPLSRSAAEDRAGRAHPFGDVALPCAEAAPTRQRGGRQKKTERLSDARKKHRHANAVGRRRPRRTRSPLRGCRAAMRGRSTDTLSRSAEEEDVRPLGRTKEKNADVGERRWGRSLARPHRRPPSVGLRCLRSETAKEGSEDDQRIHRPT